VHLTKRASWRAHFEDDLATGPGYWAGWAASEILPSTEIEYAALSAYDLTCPTAYGLTCRATGVLRPC